MSRTIDPHRIHPLNERDSRRGEYVLYWMQRSQRAEDNHALELAVQQANELGCRLLVLFVLTAGYPEANRRHYRFLLEGLAETRRSLERRGIKFRLEIGEPPEPALEASRKASLVICDRAYLRHERKWRRALAEEAACPVVEVESDLVVPVERASSKKETAARTLRPKVRKMWERYLVSLSTTPLDKDSLNLPNGSVDLAELERVDPLLDRLGLSADVTTVQRRFQGGAAQARSRLRRFVDRHLTGYGSGRNDPVERRVSTLSPYLHFGQISPLAVALTVREAKGTAEESRDAFLEELLVRRELAHNYVWYEPEYAAYGGLPSWARQTLEEHRDDEREERYTSRQLEDAATHDEAWNAAMNEMKWTGYLHNHLRMYWGKRILAWTGTPQHAFRTALGLNNRYLLDGRDAASFANIAWLFGLHDRPWPERQVFGKVRTMTRGGLDRKIDVAAYTEQVGQLAPVEDGG